MNVEIIKTLIRESEKVFNHLEKIEPYECHEMAYGTPNPDSYWAALDEAKREVDRDYKDGD